MYFLFKGSYFTFLLHLQLLWLFLTLKLVPQQFCTRCVTLQSLSTASILIQISTYKWDWHFKVEINFLSRFYFLCLRPAGISQTSFIGPMSLALPWRLPDCHEPCLLQIYLGVKARLAVLSVLLKLCSSWKQIWSNFESRLISPTYKPLYISVPSFSYSWS